MKKMKLLFAGIILLLSTTTLLWPQTGLTLEKKITNSGMMARGNTASSATVHLTDSFIRTHDGRTEDIILFQEGRLIKIDHPKRRYSEITFEELQADLDAAAAKLSGKENAEAMEMMKRMMGGAAGEISVEKLGPGGEIAGYSTQKYTISMPPLNMVLWVAPDLKVPNAYYDSMKLRVAPNPMFDMGKMIDAFKKIEGYPLKTETSMKMMGMEGSQVDEVVSVTRGAVPPVSIPDGYKKVPFDKM